MATLALALQAYSYSHWACRPTELEIAAIQGQRFDLNKAERAQLLQVPGIGEALAKRIEESREESGPFQTLEDLTRVRGIGQVTLERFRPWLAVRDARSESGEARTPPRSAGRKTGKKGLPSHPINVNLAGVAELELLPGIGPKLAQRIIDARAKGSFGSAGDLRRVPGIGPKILEKIRPFVIFEPDAVAVSNTFYDTPSAEPH